MRLTSIQRSRSIQLVGSIPLHDTETVFRTTSSILGGRIHRLPDGETGARSDWIGWQYTVLAHTQHLLPVPPVPGRYAARPHVKIDPGTPVSELEIGKLGYAEAALASYSTFTRMKQEGVLAAHYRFQVSLPTPLAVVTAFVERPDRAVIEPLYEERLLDELDKITTSIPHDQLAIQWDLPMEVGMIEGIIPSQLSDTKNAILDRITRISERIAPDVELGYHLCYGDDGGRHFKQPTDLSVTVEFANAISSVIPRQINWYHMPVPQDRHDSAYFKPLRNLTLSPDTELYLGLVHLTDGVEGTIRRMEAARQIMPDFGIATECGMGRRPPETIADLLTIHAKAIDQDTAENGGMQ